MASKSVKILLTGLPGCGKTTAVMQIIANLDPKKVAGFYTQEIRRNNTRKGFSWNRLDGAASLPPRYGSSLHLTSRYWLLWHRKALASSLK